MALAPGKIDSYNIAPGQSQADLDLQRKMALQLMQQGMDVSPVQHWTQGLARMLQAGMGGYDLHQQDQKEQADKAESRKLISMLSGGGSAPGGDTAAPAPVGEAPAPAAASPGAAPAPVDQSKLRKAFLDAVAGGEANGYNVKYGGGTFDSYADHPRDAVPITSGPMAGRTSSAAGRFQFLAPTWDEQRTKLGLTDFSPQNQDTAAWDLAATAYQKKTGGDLEADLADPAKRATIAQMLSGVWPSLPGGNQPNRATPNFVTRLNAGIDGNGATPPDPSAQAPRVQLAQAGGGLPQPDSAGAPAAVPAAPAAAPASANPMRGGMEPQRRMQLINGLMQTRSGAAIGQHLFGAELTKEQNQSRPLTDPRERARFGIQATDTNPYQVDSQGKVTAINPQPFSVNVNQQGQSEFEKEYGKGKAGDALTLERSADKAMQERQQLQVFKSLVQDFKTGKLAPAQSTIGAWGDAIGLAPETLAKLGVPPNAGVNGQLIESLSNQLTLGMIGTKGGEGGGMPANNFSDADRKFLQNTVPGLARMQGGNLVLTEIKQRGLDRNLEKVQMWDDYRSQGKDFAAFERDWRQKVRNSPSIFADIPDMVKQLSATPAASGAPAPASSAPAPSTEPVAVASPDEARKLPKGTRIKLPDGSTGVVP